MFLQSVFRSRHFFGRLRLRKSEVLEPTPAPTKLGRLQAKKGSSRRLRLHTLTLFIFSSLKVTGNYFLDLFYLYKLLMFDSRKRLSLFACLKDAAGLRLSAPTNKTISSGSGAALKVAAPGGSGSTTLVVIF